MANDRNVVRLYKEKLNLLLDVAQTINEDNSVDDLMQEFEHLLTDELGVGKILVFSLVGERWQCILQTNVTDEQRDAIVIERDLGRTSAGIENLALDDKPSLAGFDAVIPLRHKYKLIGYVLLGDAELGDGVSPTLRNLKFIQILSNLIIVFIENKKMQARLLEQESLKKELEVASKIQSGLVPPDGHLSQISLVRAMSYYRPHQQIGGDYFDVLELSEHSVGFCIADVSGKGVAAALLMSNFQAMVRALFTKNVDLALLAHELNKRVSLNSKGEKFITAFFGRYNSFTGVLSYVNAGHLPPLVRLADGKVKELMAGTIGLGMLDELPRPDVGSLRVHRGDLIVAYTDGLVEIEKEGNVISHQDMLSHIVSECKGIDQVMQSISQMAEQTRSAGQSFDDTSVLAIEICKKPTFSW